MATRRRTSRSKRSSRRTSRRSRASRQPWRRQHGNAAAVILRRPPGSIVLPDNSAYTNRFEIKSASSDRVYIIAQSKKGRWWACSCPGWIRHKHCKHLSAIGVPGNHKPHEAVLAR